MSRFYDPKDTHDLARVEEILQKGAIEYFLRGDSKFGNGLPEVHVAEEDMPKAEELLLKAGRL